MTDMPPAPVSRSSRRDARPSARAWRRLCRHRPALISGIFLILLLFLILLWPLVSPYHPDALSDAQFQPPGAKHLLGTDVHGRDLLSRIVFGARVSLLI